MKRTQLKTWLLTVSSVFALAFAGMLAPSSSAKAEDGWEATVHVGRILEIDSIERVVNQILDEQAGDIDGLSERYSEFLGFDPRTDVQRIHVYGSFGGGGDWDDLEDSIQAVVVDVAQSGNLEGLMLALEDYSTSEINDETVHSGTIEDFGTIHVAFIDNGNNVRIIACLSEDAMEDAIDEASPSDSANSRREGSNSQLMHFRVSGSMVSQIAADEFGDDVPAFASNFANSMTGASVAVNMADDENVEIVTRLELDDEERAEQFLQLCRAGAAFGQAMLEEEGGAEAAMILNLLDSMSFDLVDGALEIRTEAELSTLTRMAFDY